MAPQFSNGAGRPVILGKELGAGGEGAVYLVEGQSDVVAKVYHQIAPPVKAAKLKAMIGAKSPDLLDCTAWPLDVLMKGGDVKGILMPIVVNHRELHHLYSPAHRKLDFPDADWAFLIRAARNTAAAMDTIHAKGHVVGDVNQSGILVSSNAKVRMIDCDSFQIAVNGRRFTCDVGVPHFTAPELQGIAFKGLERTQNHDRFGLAVVIFHLLFMGRHPFAGRFHGSGDMPIERAIQQGRFAFSQNASSFQMTPPPNALRLNHVPLSVASLFERAFRAGSARDSRPTAGEWMASLEQLKKDLAVCPQHSGHKYFKPLKQCPWCEIVGGGGPDLFVSVNVLGRMAEQFHLDKVWNAIQSIRLPGELAHVATVARALPTTRVAAVGWEILALVYIVICLGTFIGVGVSVGSAVVALANMCGAVAVWVRSAPARRRRRERAEKLNVIKKQLDKKIVAMSEIVTRHNASYSGAAKEFNDRLQTLALVRSELKKVPSDMAQELANLNARRHELQLQAFLQAQFLDKAQVPGIGPGRKAVLASHGVETAWDITPVELAGIQGIGPSLKQALFAWRASVENRFTFDASRAVDPSQQRAIQQKYAAKTAQLRGLLTSGSVQLNAIASDLGMKKRDAIAQIGVLQEHTMTMNARLEELMNA